MNWDTIKNKALQNELISRGEALQVINSRDNEILELVQAAREVREKFFGKKVKLNYLVNIKSGICPEDCHYCSQSKDSHAPIPKYPLMTPEEIMESVENGIGVGASRACLVASGRGPSEKELGAFCESVQKLKDKYPDLEVCACMGLLEQGQADQLKEAGVTAYNHNINTSKSHYEKICGTHTYENRLNTIQKVQDCGIQACSGVLVGMKESTDDILEMAYTLREKKVESIPVNFLVSINKTPLEKFHELTPQKCLRILALFRFINPSSEIRIAGGREINLRSLQPLGLMIANSIFIGDYLTTKGQSGREDLQMIRDLGYFVEGKTEKFLDETLENPQPILRSSKVEATII